MASLRPGYSIALAALLFLMAAGCLRPMPPRRRRWILGLGLLGVALIVLSQALSWLSPAAAQTLGDWLPTLLMLIVYWMAGRFPGSPNEKLQAWLVEFDRRRLGTLLDSWIRRWSGTSAIDEYWAMVMSSSCLCYLCVPFTQTLPPRLLPACKCLTPGLGKIRRFNLFICRTASIHLNTFPSAHVASALAASLVLMRHVPVAGVVMLVVGLSIAIGAVLGRFHYALDAIFGAALPLCIGLYYWR